MGLPYALPGQFSTGDELYKAIGSTFAGPNDTYVLEDVLREGSMPSWYDETSVLANISASFKINDDFTLINKTAIDYKQNDRVFARIQVRIWR